MSEEVKRGTTVAELADVLAKAAAAGRGGDWVGIVYPAPDGTNVTAELVDEADAPGVFRLIAGTAN